MVTGVFEVDLVGIDDRGEGEPLVVVIRRSRPVCEACGGSGVVEGVSECGVG